MFVHNTCIMKYFFAIHELWKILKCLFAIHELWNICCNTWIMKIRKCLFAIHELWKYLFKIHELWNKLNVHLKHKNYEKVKIFVCNTGIMIFFLQYMNYEIKKMFVCNTWIIKMFVLIIQIIQLQIMKYENICLQDMNYEKHENVHLKHKNYEKVKIFVAIQELWKYFVCNTWIMKI